MARKGKLYKTFDDALMAAQSTGMAYHPSYADDRDDLELVTVEGDDEWNGLRWSGELLALEAEDGRLFAWWES